MWSYQVLYELILEIKLDILSYSVAYEVSPVQCGRGLHKGEIPAGRLHWGPFWQLTTIISEFVSVVWVSFDDPLYFLPLCNLLMFNCVVGFVFKETLC